MLQNSLSIYCCTQLVSVFLLIGSMFIRGNKMSSHQMQGNKRTINDAEGRTLLNSLIETPCAPENTPKRRWKKELPCCTLTRFNTGNNI
ncbi:hypothetical protein Hanom_Chr03g00266251 [Helianthus anomalus]